MFQSGASTEIEFLEVDEDEYISVTAVSNKGKDANNPISLIVVSKSMNEEFTTITESIKELRVHRISKDAFVTKGQSVNKKGGGWPELVQT